MSTKEKILRMIAETLMEFLLQTSRHFSRPEDDPESIRGTIDEFVQDSARRYSERELLDRFGSCEAILDRYSAYLEARFERDGANVH